MNAEENPDRQEGGLKLIAQIVTICINELQFNNEGARKYVLQWMQRYSGQEVEGETHQMKAGKILFDALTATGNIRFNEATGQPYCLFDGHDTAVVFTKKSLFHGGKGIPIIDIGLERRGGDFVNITAITKTGIDWNGNPYSLFTNPYTHEEIRTDLKFE